MDCEERKKAFIKRIKKNIRDARKERKMTQEAIWDNRTTVCEWEDEDNDTLPGLLNLFKISQNLGVDFEYLVGNTDVPNKNTRAIADEMHIEDASVECMRADPFCGRFIDALINAGILPELKVRIKAMAMAEICNSAIEVNFRKSLIRRLNEIYDSYIYETFPSDVSEKSFRARLQKELRREIAEPDKFAKQYFLDEGINNLKNSTDVVTADSVLDLIADFSFNYFRTRDIIEKQTERLNRMFSELAVSVINAEKKYCCDNIRKNINQRNSKKTDASS